jgi:hypothetical protein
MSVPTASATVTTPVELIVRLDAVEPAVPVIASKSIWFAAPAPTVRVAPSTNVASPNDIVPVEVPPTNKFAATVNPVSESPKVNTPLPPSAFTVPCADIPLGAVAVNPPAKSVESPVPSPKVTLPVLEKVTALVIALLAPVKDTL